VIPAYNAEAYLARAIQSVWEQTVAPAEVIVVEDGSTDATADVAAGFRERVRLIRQANAGPSEARNVGVQAARGGWVAFLDADDEWLPEKLERQIPLLSEDRTAVVCCGKLRPGGRRGLHWLTFEELWESNEIVTSTAVVRRDVLLSLGGFEKRLRACEDWHLWLRLSSAGWNIACLYEDLYRYRSAPGSLSQRILPFTEAHAEVVRRIGESVGLAPERIRGRCAAAYEAGGRSALHVRQLALARQLLVRSLRLQFTAVRAGLLAAACLPRPALDALRHLRGSVR